MQLYFIPIFGGTPPHGILVCRGTLLGITALEVPRYIRLDYGSPFILNWAQRELS
jgi:hypothetical protein